MLNVTRSCDMHRYAWALRLIWFIDYDASVYIVAVNVADLGAFLRFTLHG